MADETGMNIGFCLWKSSDIFNILNQTDINYPRLSDPNYLLLLDTRSRKEYNESHILTAKFAPRKDVGSFVLPYEADLQIKTYCVVYDSRTSSLNDKGSPAISCARLLWDMGSKNPVIIIKGGFEDFSALYPFLRTQKVIYTQRELDCIDTFPVEVIPGCLYIGTLRHGQNPAVSKALKVKAYVNLMSSQNTNSEDENLQFNKVFHIPVQDSNKENIYDYFENVVKFIDQYKDSPGQSVLVCSKLNISRSVTIAIAYLMWKEKWDLQKAYSHVKRCKTNMQPNSGFIRQLSQWEEKLHGKFLTDISEPDY